MDPLFVRLNTFVEIPDQLQQYISRIAKPKQVRKKDILLREGEINDMVFFLDSGWVKIFCRTDNGEDVVLWFLKTGDIVVDPPSFFDQMPSGVYIQASEDCSIRYITYAEYVETAQLYPKFAVLADLIKTKYYVNKQLEEQKIRSLSNLDKVKWFRDNYTELFYLYGHKDDIASFLGMRRETFYKYQSRLTKKG